MDQEGSDYETEVRTQGGPEGDAKLELLVHPIEAGTEVASKPYEASPSSSDRHQTCSVCSLLGTLYHEAVPLSRNCLSREWHSAESTGGIEA